MPRPEERTDADADTRARPDRPGTPRWVKVFGIIAIVLALLLVIMLLTGKHGPARHMLPGDADRHAARMEHGGPQP